MKFIIILLYSIISISCKSMSIDTSKYKMDIKSNELVTSHLFLDDIIIIERQFNEDNYITFHFPRTKYDGTSEVIMMIYDYETHICITMAKFLNVRDGTTIYIKAGHYIAGFQEGDNYYYVELK